MSRDLIVFDPSELDGMSGDRSKILESVDNYLLDNETAYDAEEPVATAPVQALLDSVKGQYIAAYLDANGRYCNINGPGATDDWENTVIMYCEAAQKAGVILIDPQGNVPVMTTPGGDGLLDGM